MKNMDNPRWLIRWALTLSAALGIAIVSSRAQFHFPKPENLIPDSTFDSPSSATPVRVYFPPDPPPLGSAVDSGPPWAPAELAEFVNETFYPALAMRLNTKTLSDKLRGRLEQYRATKLALQNELRAELQRLRAVEPAARTPELIALSRGQTPKLVELEEMAEKLRRDLTSSEKNWGVLRAWSLNDREPRGYTPAEVAQVMRAAAYEQASLSLNQRGLLREIAIELGTPADSTGNATWAQPYLFFSPAPARILLPDDLPADVTSKLAAYQTNKSALKKELYDTVYASDRKGLDFLRNPLKALAGKQGARLADLEALAEEIRLGLVDHAKPNPMEERLQLSPGLQSRVHAIVAGFLTAQKEAAAKIDAVVATAKDLPMRVSYRFDGERLKYWFSPLLKTRSTGRSAERRDGADADLAQRIETVRAGISAAADEYQCRLPELIKEKKAIRDEMIETLGDSKAAQIDYALRTAQANQTDSPYLEYRIAVFQPGLSPEQRRLLFDGAIERLELQLPRGEFQPRYRRQTR